jgi:hypothetical protein
MTAVLPWGSTEQLSPERQRLVAAGINAILKDLGRPPESIDGWWNQTTYAELDGRTPVQAWLSGHQDDVRRLVVSLGERSLAAAERAMADPAIAEQVRQQLARLR